MSIFFSFWGKLSTFFPLDKLLAFSFAGGTGQTFETFPHFSFQNNFELRVRVSRIDGAMQVLITADIQEGTKEAAQQYAAQQDGATKASLLPPPHLIRHGAFFTAGS